MRDDGYRLPVRWGGNTPSDGQLQAGGVVVKFKTTIVYGHCEIKQFCRFEDDRLVFYGYSINYDRDGREVSRTKPSSTGCLYFDQPIKPVPWWKRYCMKILRVKG